MSSITRGHTFDLTDIVTAQTLNDLVRRATISGLTVADIPGSSAQISVFSAASGAGPGWISAQYERLRTASNSSSAEFKYVLTSPAGEVALFNPYGLETRRFYQSEGGFSHGQAGLVSLGSAGITLTATFAYSTGFPQHHHIGGVANSAASGTFPRFVMRGPIPANVVDAGGPLIRKYYYLLNASTAQYQHSAGATNTDKVLGMSLDLQLEGDTRIPAFLFGAPIWRSA